MVPAPAYLGSRRDLSARSEKENNEQKADRRQS